MKDHPTLPANKAEVVLTKTDYSINIDVKDIEDAVKSDGSCWIENFTIKHHMYGKVMFRGRTNIAKLDLDKIGKKFYSN